MMAPEIESVASLLYSDVRTLHYILSKGRLGDQPTWNDLRRSLAWE